MYYFKMKAISLWPNSDQFCCPKTDQFILPFTGVLGIVLMVSSIKVMPGVILDFRHIATILSATYCGFAASILTGLIIGIFRFAYTADFSYQSILPALSAIIIGIGCGLIIQLKISKLKRWVSMTLLSLIPSCLTMYILINNNL